MVQTTYKIPIPVLLAGILFLSQSSVSAAGIFDLREQELLTVEERVQMRTEGSSAFVVWGRPYLESLPKAGFIRGLRLKAAPGRWRISAESVFASSGLHPEFSSPSLGGMALTLGYKFSKGFEGSLWIEPFEEGREFWAGPLVTLLPVSSLRIQTGTATTFTLGEQSRGWSVDRNHGGRPLKWFLGAQWQDKERLEFYVHGSFEDHKSLWSRSGPGDVLGIEKIENRTVLVSAEGAGFLRIGHFYGNFGFTLERRFSEENETSPYVPKHRILERRYHDGWEIRFSKGKLIPYIGERYFYYIESYQQGTASTQWLRNGRSRPLVGLEIPWGRRAWFRGEFGFHLHTTKIFKYYLLKAGKQITNFGFRGEFGLIYEIDGVANLTGHLVAVWGLP